MGEKLSASERARHLRSIRDAWMNGGRSAAEEVRRRLLPTVRHQLRLELDLLIDDLSASSGPPGTMPGGAGPTEWGSIGASPPEVMTASPFLPNSDDVAGLDDPDGGLLERMVPGATQHQERRRRAAPIRDAVLSGILERAHVVPHLQASICPPPDFDDRFLPALRYDRRRRSQASLPLDWSEPETGQESRASLQGMEPAFLTDAPRPRFGGAPPRSDARYRVERRSADAEELCRKIARGVLEDAGVEHEPVDLDVVAFRLGIVLHRAQLGVEHDALLAHGDGVAVLITNRSVESEDRLRYADAVGIAHALLSMTVRRSLNLSPERARRLSGHAMYLSKLMKLQDMREVRFLADARDLRRRSIGPRSVGDGAEAAARALGQELLLPFDLLPDSPDVPSFSDAEDLAEEFEAPVSVVLEAMVRRSESACALVISVRGMVVHAVFSFALQERQPELRAEVTEDSAAHWLLGARGHRTSPRAVGMDVWFVSIAEAGTLTDHSRRMGDDVVYTVLSLT